MSDSPNTATVEYGPAPKRRKRYQQRLTTHDRDFIRAIVAGGPFIRLAYINPYEHSHSSPVTDLDRLLTRDVRRLLTALLSVEHPERLPELRRLVASLALDDALLGTGKIARARLALEALKLDKAAEAASVASRARAKVAAAAPQPTASSLPPGRSPRSLS